MFICLKLIARTIGFFVWGWNEKKSNKLFFYLHSQTPCRPKWVIFALIEVIDCFVRKLILQIELKKLTSLFVKMLFNNFQELADVKNQRLQLAQDEFNHLHSTLSNISAVSTTSRKTFQFEIVNWNSRKCNQYLIISSCILSFLTAKNFLGNLATFSFQTNRRSS